jgi:hypothetical protein
MSGPRLDLFIFCSLPKQCQRFDPLGTIICFDGTFKFGSMFKLFDGEQTLQFTPKLFLSGYTEPLSLAFLFGQVSRGGFDFANRDGRCQLYLIINRRKGEKKSAPNRRKMQVGVIW